MAVVLGQSTVAYATTAINANLAERVADEYETVGSANAALANLLQMEAEWRVYVLTGRLESLYGYVSQHTALWTRLTALMAVSANDPAGAARWSATADQVTQWERDALRVGFALRREALDGQATPLDLTSAVTTGPVPSELRVIGERFRLAVEDQRDDALGHQGQMQTWSVILMTLAPTGGAITAILSALLAFGVQRARGRARAQRERARLEGVLLAARTTEHEIGNHLALTRGYAELLAQSDHLPPDLRVLAEQAVQGAREAAEVVRDLTRLEELQLVMWPELESTVAVHED
jgi:hypothetical protein